MVQRTVGSPVNIYVNEGEMALTFSLYSELNALVDTVQVIRGVLQLVGSVWPDDKGGVHVAKPAEGLVWGQVKPRGYWVNARSVALPSPRQYYTSSGPLSATCLQISTDPTPLPSIDYSCGPLSLPPCSYIGGCPQLVAQYAATCSRWFLARGFFNPEDGGDTFLQNVGSHKIYTAPHPRR
jgi:hypothetical protein